MDEYKRKNQIYDEIPKMIKTLDEYLHLLGKCDYSPYKEKNTKLAIKALKNIRGEN